MKARLLTIFFLTFMVIACQYAPAKSNATEIIQVTVQEASEAVKQDGVQFIDVRTPEEYKSGHAPKSENMPLNTFETDLAKLQKDKPVYVICQTGRRSQLASESLKKAGVKDVFNVSGGISEWTAAELPLVE